MRRLSILTFVAVFAMAFIGCTTADNTTVKTNSAMNANSNVAVVVNSSNTNTTVISSTNANSSTWSSNITREEYDKNKEDYANRAKSAGSTIGSGLNDGWIWTKTKAALAASNDLRDSTINVDVSNDVITLRGTVATAAQKTAAVAAAKGIEGQKGVKDELKVQANDSLTNQTIGTGNATKSNTNANMKK